MKSSFRKRVKCANPKIDVLIAMASLEIVSGKTSSEICIYKHIHMWNALYQNTIFELSIGIASAFTGMALSAFWKRALNMDYECGVYCICVECIYICIYMTYICVCVCLECTCMCVCLTFNGQWYENQCPLEDIDFPFLEYACVEYIYLCIWIIIFIKII